MHYFGSHIFLEIKWSGMLKKFYYDIIISDKFNIPHDAKFDQPYWKNYKTHHNQMV